MDSTPDPTLPPTRPPAPPRWPTLDGLRGLAVAAVLAYHLGHLSGGFLGVDLFFVLSGFLITSLLLREGEGGDGIDLRRFWIRRARRLLPALGATLIGVVVVSRAFLDHDRLPDLRLDAIATLAYVANWRFALEPTGGYFAADPSPLRHAWSLSIEEQYYLLWPLVVAGAIALATRRRRPAPVVVGAIAAAGAVASVAWTAAHAGSWDVERLYLGTDTRVVAPLVGAALAAVFVRRPGGAPAAGWVAPASGLAVIGLAVATATVEATDGWLYRGGLGVVALVAAVAVGGSAVAGTSIVGRVLSLPPLRWLGERSYGIYLYSWPVQVVAEDQGLDGATLAATTVAVSLLLAEASHRWLEMPIRSGGLAVPRMQPAATAALAFVLVAGVVVVGTMTQERPDPLQAMTDEELREDALRPALEPEGTDGSDGSDPQPGTAGTAAGDPVRVLVVGDSVGYTLGTYAPDDLDDVSSVDARALPGCSLLTSGERPPEAVEAGSPETYDDCAGPVADADRLGLAGDPDVVLLVTGAWERADHERDGRTVGPDDRAWTFSIRQLLAERVAALSADGAMVALWADPCGPDADARERQRWYRDRVLASVADADAHAVLIDPTSEVCHDGEAKEVDDVGDPRPDDGQHWSEEGADWLWRSWLGPTLREVGAPGAQPVSAAVFGDSIAFTLDYEGRAGADAAGIDLVHGSAAIGCGLVREGLSAGGDRDLAEQCAGVTQLEDDVIAGTTTDVAVAYWGAWEMSGVDDVPAAGSGRPGDPAYDAFVAGLLAERLDAMATSSREVAVLAVDCWPQVEDTRTPEQVRWWRDLSSDVAAEAGATYLDPTEVLCRDGEPRADLPGIGNPRPDDGGHWSAEGASWFWTEWLGPRLHELAGPER